MLCSCHQTLFDSSAFCGLHLRKRQAFLCITCIGTLHRLSHNTGAGVQTVQNAYRFTLLPGSCALFLFFSSLLLFHGCGNDRIGVKLAFPIHNEHTPADASTRPSLCRPASVVREGTRHKVQGDQTVKKLTELVSEHAQKFRREAYCRFGHKASKRQLKQTLRMVMTQTLCALSQGARICSRSTGRITQAPTCLFGSSRNANKAATTHVTGVSPHMRKTQANEATRKSMLSFL